MRNTIIRAKMVKIRTEGKNNVIMVENSKMSAKKIRRFLEQYGGKEREGYYWFPSIFSYEKVICALLKKGIYLL